MGFTAAQVDLLLALRTTVAGNTEALTYLDKIDAAAKKAATGWEQFQQQFTSGLNFGGGLGLGLMVAQKLVEKIGEVAQQLDQAVTNGLQFNATMELSQRSIAGVLKQFDAKHFGDWNAAMAASGQVIEMLKAKATSLGLNFGDLAHQYQATAGAMFKGGVTDLQQQVDLTVLLSRTTHALGIEGFQAVRDISDILNGIANRTMLGRMLHIDDADLKAASDAGNIYGFLTEKLQGFQAAADASMNTLTGLQSRLDAAKIQAEAKATEELVDVEKDLLRAQIALANSNGFQGPVHWWAAVLGDLKAIHAEIDYILAHDHVDHTTVDARQTDLDNFKRAAGNVRSQDDVAAAQKQGAETINRAVFGYSQTSATAETKAALATIIASTKTELDQLQSQADERIKANLAKQATAEKERWDQEDAAAADKKSENVATEGLREVEAEEKQREREAELAVQVINQRLKERDAILATADAQAKLNQEIAKINEFRGIDPTYGGLTDEQADAKVAQLRAQFATEQEIAKQKEATLVLDGKLAAIGTTIAQVENDHALTKKERETQLLPLYEDENKLIADRLKLLQDEAALKTTTDPKLIVALQEQIARLQKELASGQGKVYGIQHPDTLAGRDANALASAGLAPNASGKTEVDESSHYATAGAGMLGSLQAMAAQIGTLGDMMNRAFTSIGQGIRSSLGGAFDDMLLKSGSFRGKMVTLWNGLVTSFVHAGTSMAADWAMKHTFMAAISHLFNTKDAAEHLVSEMTKTTVTTTAAGVRTTVRTTETVTSTALKAVDVTAHVVGEETKTAATAQGSGIRLLTSIREALVSVYKGAIDAFDALAQIPYVGPFLGAAAMAAAIVGGMALINKMGHAEGGFHAGPGWVSGPGTATSDSINARLSDGEWVAPVWMTQHPVYGPMVAALEAARTGAPGYKFGGFFSDVYNLFGGVRSFSDLTHPDRIAKRMLDAQEHPITQSYLKKLVHWDTPATAMTWDNATGSWVTTDPAAAVTQPAYQAPSASPSGGTTGGSGTSSAGGLNLSLQLVDYRDKPAINAANRNPLSNTQTVAVIDARLKQLRLIV